MMLQGIEEYSMTRIESELGLTREKLIALGVLAGCDFLPKGVPGVGQAKAVKLLQEWTSVDPLKK